MRLSLQLSLSLLALSSLVPALALAHGGLPVSQTIMRRGDQVLVPTLYWGVFFGRDPADGGGPWRWICEEAINQNQARKWALTSNGTYHVTDFGGITSSRDGGCTWIASTGEIAKRATSGVVADPADGKRAWATTNQANNQANDVPWNALFVTSDDGQSWTPTLMADEYLREPAISRDGQTIYVIGVGRPMGSQTLTLHASRDGGKSFTSAPLAFSIDGKVQLAIDTLAVDPKDSAAVYLAVRGEAVQVLLKATGQGAQLVEQLRIEGTIGGIAFDDKRDAVLLSVGPLAFKPLAAGLMRSVAGGPFAPLSNLSRSQCVLADGDRVYACSSSFPPDSAAVARSDDGGAHFSKVFQYVDTVGPTLDCAPSTPVGKICPGIWEMYWVQQPIGPDMAQEVAPPDAALPVIVPPAGCSCEVARRPHEASRPLLALALLMLVAATSLRGRRFHGTATSPVHRR